jgi:hypothetical protein
MFLLILTCAALGALLAWGIREHGERARLSARNHEVENSYVFVLAKRNTLASFLTDPRTHLYRLAGRNEAAGREVTVAWQAETSTGVLIGDRMPLPPDDAMYALWHVGTNGQVAPVGTFRPDAAGTFHDFRLNDPPADGTGGFRVTVETDRNPRAPGQTIYESR